MDGWIKDHLGMGREKPSVWSDKDSWSFLVSGHIHGHLHPRGEDLGVEYLYRGSSFVEKVEIKGCWNKKATVSVIRCQPKETCSSNSCTAWVPSAAQKSAWAFPKSCPFCLALRSSVLPPLAFPPATVCFLGTWRGLGVTLINPCSLALVTRTSKESSAWRSRGTIWGWASTWS